jgi:hypothetical protein
VGRGQCSGPPFQDGHGGSHTETGESMKRGWTRLDHDSPVRVRSVKVPDAIWDKARRVAAVQRVSVSEIVRDWMEATPEPPPPPDASCLCACGRGPAVIVNTAQKGEPPYCFDCRRERMAKK